MDWLATLGIAVVVAAPVSLAATWPLRRLAIRRGILDDPVRDRHKSHREPVPYLGGVAIFAGAAASLALAHQHHFWGLLGLLGLVAALGLYDDLFHASVPAKVIGELSIAVAAVAIGYTWHITVSEPLNIAISLVWIVGLTNSFNLLDNMDGLTSTIAATALLGTALLAGSTAPLAGAMAGALAGFLVVNRPPARMYMGDCGSLQVGLAVALVTIAAADTAAGLHSVVLLAGPVALGVFDTTLVIVSRVRAGRPIQLGGRDHFSHRLQLLGWGRPAILVASFGATAAAVGASALAARFPAPESALALPLGVAFAGAWLRLLRTDPYTAAVNSRPEVLSA